MAFSFPASPSEGQVYNGAPGVSFVYSSGAWAPAPMKTALPKNYFVNPTMSVSQQLGNAVTVSNTFTVDQFNMYGPGASCQRVQAAVTPNGSLNRIRAAVTSTPVYTQYNTFTCAAQMEYVRLYDLGWGTSKGKQVVVRFGIKAPAGTYSVCIQVYATRPVSIYLQFTISAGQANTDTEQVIIIPPPPIGDDWTPPNTSTWMAMLYIAFQVGSYYNGGTPGVWDAVSGRQYQANASNTNGGAVIGNTFEVFDMGFYADPYMTGVPPPFEAPFYEDELRRSQRYWYRAYGLQSVVKNATDAQRGGWRHPVPMAKSPSLYKFGAMNMYDGVITPAVTYDQTDWNNIYALEADFTTAGTFATVGKAAAQYYQNDDIYTEVRGR